MALVVEDGDPQILKEITHVTMSTTEGQVMRPCKWGHQFDGGRIPTDYSPEDRGPVWRLLLYRWRAQRSSGERSEGLRRFGITFGSAFQLVDDALDFTGKEQRLGKPVGVTCGRQSYPSRYHHTAACLA